MNDAIRVLVVGGGGREHALAWKIAQSPLVAEMLCAPGNPGTATVAENIDIAADDVRGLLAMAGEKAVDLVVVGPEAPLAAGLADACAERGLAVFGPTQAAAQLEASKVFAKEFMRRHQIPTADFEVFDTLGAARDYLESREGPIVVKADGLAAGKGVVVAQTRADAIAAVEHIMGARAFGDAGNRVVIEECLPGREVSLIALTDGTHVVPCAPARDHKRLLAGDEGPNTGGMGAYTPPPDVTPELQTRIVEEILAPTVAGMAADGHPVRGALYAGVMVTDGVPRVLEFNVRFGDPETQPLMARLTSDLVPALLAASGRDASFNCATDALAFDERAATCVVLASGGYPGKYEKGKPIDGIEQAEALDDVLVFHAGTRADGNAIVTAGGRVLGVTALGASVRAASDRAYEAVQRISWDGMQYRNDIGR